MEHILTKEQKSGVIRDVCLGAWLKISASTEGIAPCIWVLLLGLGYFIINVFHSGLFIEGLAHDFCYRKFAWTEVFYINHELEVTRHPGIHPKPGNSRYGFEARQIYEEILQTNY